MPTTTSKPIILLAFANEFDQRLGYLRGLPEELRQLQSILTVAEQSNHCRLEVISNATLDTILDKFRQHRDQIALFHYGGHADSYRLLFEETGGQRAEIDAAGFAGFLGQQSSLQLVFLNACSTRQQVDELLNQQIPSVIATSQDIYDEVAVQFAGQFYKSLVSGAGIERSFREATGAVQAAGGRPSARGSGEEAEGTQSEVAQPGVTRGLRLVTADGPPSGQLPWELHVRSGADEVRTWNLPQAVNDLYFGLPPLPDMDLPPVPFRHLHWFRREDAPIFFGRGKQIRELYQYVTDPQGDPIILFYGQSGVGKSSLLAAGLLPRLEESHEVVYLRRDPQTGLVGALDSVLRPPPFGTGCEAANLPRPSPTPELVEGVREAWLAREATLNKPLLIVLDQVEELYTRPNKGNLTEFADFLSALTAIFGDRGQRPQGKLILGFRKEWLAEVEKRLLEASLPASKLFLQRLDRPGIVEAITGVADSSRHQQRYGLTVDNELPGLIADDLLEDYDSAIAPTLQILLSKLWEKAKDRNENQPRFSNTMAGVAIASVTKARDRNGNRPRFSTDLYTFLRREGVALRDFLDQQLISLADWNADAVDSGLALDLLYYHTTPLGTAEGRSQTELNEAYDHCKESLPELLQECKRRFLLIDPTAEGQQAITASRLAHDALAPLVRERFDESDLPSQRARRILESRVVDWQGGAEGTPLDDADLVLVEAGLAGMRGLSADERRLVDMSVAERTKQQEAALQLAQEKEAAQARELKLEKQSNRRLLSLIGLLASVIIALLAVVARPVYTAWMTRGELVYIPSGTATIGTDDPNAYPEEQPETPFSLNGFWIEQFEVTIDQYQSCVDVGRCDESPMSSFSIAEIDGNHPIRYVTGVQAAKYCRWLGRRLPTELEWERAARGSKGGPWPWEEPTLSNDRVRMPIDGSGADGTVPVSELAAGRSHEGEIHHLVGNVWEWTSSYYSYTNTYDNYDHNLFWDGEIDSLKFADALIIRGGGWSGGIFAVTDKQSLGPNIAANDLGIRCAKDE